MLLDLGVERDCRLLSSGLSTTNSNLTVLSTSASSGIASLSSGLSTTNSNLTSFVDLGVERHHVFVERAVDDQ